MEKNFWRLSGIRKKLIIYYLIITILMGITSFYSYYSARLIISRLNSIFIDYVYLNNLYSDLSSLETSVEKYLTTKSSEALLDYYTLSNKLQSQAMELSRSISYDKNGLMLKDIGNMMKSLLSETDAAVNAKRGRISSEYLAHFTESSKIVGFIKLYINDLLYNKLQEGSQKYYAIKGKMAIVSFLNVFLILGALVLNVFLAMYFTYKITRPIIELSRSAERISSGNFDMEPLKIQTDDEVNVLAEAFNRMAISIKDYIDKIKQQAEVEKKLQEQEMQNLRMKGILKEAELKALQSQINPHFLFNTLNAASQLTLMEGAEKSSVFIENVANLFRYNLRRLDKPVTLRDEIDNVKTYMYILKTRFGDKVEFYVDVREELLDIEVPCMVIQPVVENAFIHGIEGLERSGKIIISVRKKDNYVAVEVSDDGLGMDETTINSILAVETPDNITDVHLSGIGMHNVIQRLMLFYNANKVSDVVEIFSRKGEGTQVILKIPLVGGDSGA